MTQFTGLRQKLEGWGGGTAFFFLFTHGSHDLLTGLLVGLLPVIRESMGLNYLQSGGLISAYAITSGLSQFFGGWSADRFSRRSIITIGMAGVGLSAIAVSLSPSYAVMLGLLVVMGIFSGGYHPSATPLVTSYFEKSKHGRVIAIHMLGGSLGFSSSPVIGGFIASRLDWRFAFIILAIPALIAAAILLFKFKERRSPEYTQAVTDGANENSKHVSTADRGGRSRIKLVIDTLKPIGLLTTLAILFQFVAGCAMAFIALYLVDKHDISTVYAAMWVGIIRGGGIAGSLLGGWLSDKWGRRNALTLVLVITGPILFMVTRLPFGVVLIAVMLLLGLTMNMRQSTLQPLLVAYTPPALMATVFGFYFGLSMEGSSMIQPVAGYFMDIIGINQVFDILAFIALGLSTVALLLWRKDRAAGRNQEKA